MQAGCARLLLTTGPAPAFPTGVLCSHFNLPPPLHSAYNAPFLPELLEVDCEPLLPRRIWHAPVVPETVEPELPQELQVEVLDAERLAGELAPLVIELWQQGAAAEAGLRPPDALEIAFLLALWRVAPLTLLLASWAGEPAGFALLQPEVGPALRRLRGGYALWARLWLARRPPHIAPSGRLLLGGVAARAAGQGIGAALWRRCQAHARSHGWRALAVGPVDEGDPLEAFLAARGGEPRQRSVLFAYGDAGGGAMEPTDFAW
jgi:GNAT superfamily N-acetyltransferase